MATLYEYYNTGDDHRISCYGIDWVAQTFTPATAHKITSVKLLLYRLGSPGTITVGIRETDVEGHPTGDDLCSGTTNGNTLPTGSPYEWREITLGDGYNLDADTKYAIVVRAVDGDTSNRLQWRWDETSPTYAGGYVETSDDSGSTWESYTDADLMFEDWGEPLGVTHELAGVAAGVASVSGATLLTRGLAGSSAGVCSISGLAVVAYVLAGIAQGQATVSAALGVIRTLAGVSTGAASVVASLAITRWLSGLSKGLAMVVGILWVGKKRPIRILQAVRNLPAVRNIAPER